jgi:hypothetical protein
MSLKKKEKLQHFKSKQTESLELYGTVCIIEISDNIFSIRKAEVQFV